MSKSYEIVNINTKIHCKTRVAFKGDTVSVDEVLKPTIIDGLVACGKIKEVTAPKTSKKPEKKVEPKTESKTSTEEKSSDKKASKKKSK